MVIGRVRSVIAVNCENATVTGDAVVREGGRSKLSWWQVLRTVLVVGWVAWAGFTWWSAPRESSAEQVRADVAAQRLTYFEWGDRWTNNTYGSPLRVDLASTGGPGPILLWHTANGRQHYAVIGDDMRTLDGELQAYDSRRTATEFPATAVLGALSIAGGVLFLWALVSAPDPVTGTRWFWFWLVSGVPLGLGLLWWLARERPWSSRATVRENRLRWWAGLGIGFLASVAIDLAL
jgi:hypothetical protein